VPPRHPFVHGNSCFYGWRCTGGDLVPHTSPIRQPGDFDGADAVYEHAPSNLQSGAPGAQVAAALPVPRSLRLRHVSRHTRMQQWPQSPSVYAPAGPTGDPPADRAGPGFTLRAECFCTNVPLSSMVGLARVTFVDRGEHLRRLAARATPRTAALSLPAFDSTRTR
jgi:hypothetical protein